MSNSRCYLEINRNNFRHNVIGLQKILPAQTKILGIIKANYYGHGDLEMAEIMQQQGVNDFSVATLREAVSLRQRGLKGSLLVLGYVDRNDWLKAHIYDVIMTIASFDQIAEMTQLAKEKGVRFAVEVKVDTGMHRIGIDPHLPDDQLAMIYDNPNLQVIGTYSHLCRADSFAPEDVEFTHKQKDLYDQFLQRLKDKGYASGRTHLCASPGILNYPEFVYDFVRPGFMLLGFTVGEVRERYQRKPVMAWYSKVEMVKTLEADEGISYGHIYRTDRQRKIASLTVGYGDGYPRRLSNKGHVVINGVKVPIVGRICMDQMMVDVSDVDCKREDVATLFGEGYSVDELARDSETIVDEIVCDINERVERIYL